MRCHICNATLSAAEIQWNTDHKDWDPCTTCQEVIDSVFNDSTEEEIDKELNYELELEHGQYADLEGRIVDGSTEEESEE